MQNRMRAEEKMAVQVRKAGDRGYFNYGWLRTYRTFSFADYHDPDYRGFRSLRVINEDHIRPGTGFPVQSHQDMEIFSIVVDGKISHQDDLGNGSILYPGQIQLLSAGKGVTHTEYNASDKEEAYAVQFWIVPKDRNLKPSYQEKKFGSEQLHNQLCLIISADGREGSLHIHQDANVYLAWLDEGKDLNYELPSNRYGWLQILKGEVEFNHLKLEKGDGAAISETSHLNFKAHTPSQFVLLDLN
jgi:quercetin 2,3-dioxygenase